MVGNPPLINDKVTFELRTDTETGLQFAVDVRGGTFHTPRTSERVTGTVKKYLSSKGFGFIGLPDGGQIFVN